jgi:hypothetical protein
MSAEAFAVAIRLAFIDPKVLSGYVYAKKVPFHIQKRPLANCGEKRQFGAMERIGSDRRAIRC